MTSVSPDPQADQLRDAFLSLRGDDPALELARASLVAAVQGNPELYSIALEETSYPQAELDLRLPGEEADPHTARADWFGLFVRRMALAVNEVTKSMAKRKRLTPGLRVLGPTSGSVRVVLRAPLPESSPATIPRADDTTAESQALKLITGLMVMVDQNRPPDEKSPITAAVQGLTGSARSRVRAVARSVRDTGWEIEGQLSQRGRPMQHLRFNAVAAERLYNELDRRVEEMTHETLEGVIDGQRHSLGTMWFIPAGQDRAIEVAITDSELHDQVARLSAVRDTRVEARFAVFVTTPAGATEGSRRSYELERIQELAQPMTLG